MKSKKANIESDKWYTLKDLVEMKLFPWALTFPTARKMVQRDREKKNILKANIIGAGNTTRYHFKGENIIKFIKLIDEGKTQI